MPLITTKFHPSLSPGRLTARPRLEQRLAIGLEAGCRLVLITAPAGFGKTTLIAAWLASQGREVTNRGLERHTDIPAPSSQPPTPSIAWLSLDEHDNDPRLFLRYLITALQQIDPSFGNLLPQLMTQGESGYDELLADLVNTIAALEKPVVLALDDAHHLKHPAVIHQLTFLLDHAPPSLHLMICTREDLPLPVARLRAQRQLLELRQADLRFTLEETTDFLCEGMQLPLTGDDIQALTQRTEGWIAGLQLAALSLQDQSEPQRFVRDFTGSDRYILDYLLDEVYARQLPEIQAFLLQTSILERMCAPLCDSLLGNSTTYSQAAGCNLQSQQLLEALEHANLFLIPLDHQRVWYRYHHLFGDLLRHRLSVEHSPAFIAELHRRACQWFEVNESILEAARHALASSDWAFAAAMVERHGITMLERSEISALAGWCAAFPEAIIRVRPRLCVLHAWTMVLELRSNDRALVEERLAQADAALACTDADTRVWVEGHIAGIRGHLLMADPDVDPAALIFHSRQALALLPETAGSLRSVNALRIAYGYLGLSDTARALSAYDEAQRLALATGNYYGFVSSMFDQARIAHAQGLLHCAVERCDDGQALFQSSLNHVTPLLPAVGCLDIARGCVLLEWNDLGAAERCLLRGLEQTGAITQFAMVGYPALAQLRAIRGDLAGMHAALNRLESPWPEIRLWIEALRHQHALRLAPDDPQTRMSAAVWANANQPHLDAFPRPPGIGKTFEQARYGLCFTWARIQVALGKAEITLPILEWLSTHAQQHGLNHRVIELALTQSLAFNTLGQRTHALPALQRAITLAEPEGYIRTFDQGLPLKRLLADAAAHGIASTYIERLLAAFGDQGSGVGSQGSGVGSREPGAETYNAPTPLHPHIPTPPHPYAPTPPHPDPLIELLSDRELEVLHLLAEDPSYDIIAQRMIISPNTVKTHLKHIYDKLGVNSRRQALARARELGLLS
jgi:LuxR family maltose regulon positive regulatory protein